MEKKNIYQKLSEVMKEVSYLKRGSAGQGTGVLYDEAISVIREHLINNGILITTSKHGESRSRQTTKGHYVFECDYKISYINIENPEDRLETIIESHALDSGDKAPGKSATYATKTSLLKVLSMETGENDESREELREKETINTAQYYELAKYCLVESGGQTVWSPVGEKLAAAYRINILTELPKSKFKDALQRCQKLAEVKNENN